MRYIALLRGINVGGNKKVSMAELKESLTAAGLSDVRTYINSGNVLFSAPDQDVDELTERVEKSIEERFGFPVGCIVLTKEQYERAIDDAPKNWGTDDKNMRSDALFVMRSMTPQRIVDAVGEVNDDFEWMSAGRSVVFWTVDRRKYGRARMPKIIGTDAYRAISMRSSTTARKLYLLLNE